MGDMHFSQGDGEVSFCGAIEMSGFLELKCAPVPLNHPPHYKHGCRACRLSTRFWTAAHKFLSALVTVCTS